MPIVLTANEVVLNPEHKWDDVEGVQYHYPNNYKNLIQPGVEFVYYRGVHRRDGRRAQGEYFGFGRIGDVRQDPATEGQSRPSWFCSIEDYIPFNPPVPAKPDGVFLEQIPQNMWRNGVRALDQQTYDAIVARASISQPAKPVSLPQLADASDIIIPRANVEGGSQRETRRFSKRAKEIGDWAEQRAVEFIESNLNPAEIHHRAKLGETPGWDIDFVDSDGFMHRVEVKGTTGAAFAAIDLTAGELAAAQVHGDSYWLYLVASCLTDHPRIARIRHPASRIASGEWRPQPTLYRVRLA